MPGVPGPTGKFPQGKLDKNDQGELCFAVGVKDGQVFLDFGTMVAWLAMPPETAQQIGQSLIEKANKIEQGYN